MAPIDYKPLGHPGGARIHPTSYGEIAEKAGTVLAGLRALGVRTSGTRFDRYERFLVDATKRTYPHAIDWVAGAAEHAYEVEAIGQFVQLASALSLRDQLDAELLRLRLVEIVKGPESPSDDDRPRNILLELAAGAMLSQPPLVTVSLTHGTEDLVLQVDGLPDFPIECKRPSVVGALERNVHRARRQLRGHRVRYPNGGILVIGIDRLVGLSGRLPVLATPEAIRTTVTGLLEETCLEVARVGGERLARVAVMAITLLAGAVWTQEPAMPTAILRGAVMGLPAGPRRAQLIGLLGARLPARESMPFMPV